MLTYKDSTHKYKQTIIFNKKLYDIYIAGNDT
jgi:hypothetical protein